jgi:hypothetical protein
MKPCRFTCLFAIFISTMVLAQSNTVPLISQSAKVVSPGAASGANPKAQAKSLNSLSFYGRPWRSLLGLEPLSAKNRM